MTISTNWQIAKLEDVLEEASSNPVIYYSLRRWQIGEIDLETALMTAVMALSVCQKQLQVLVADLLDEGVRVDLKEKI